ncbi:hypothetical protein [Arsenophonus sp. PmNCSU2021_1]|uniref:hypothetical protein n=1 Tax=Arsenophonus sp. PmNCSU2021_1 TaxID=3118989 RepID=UPI002FF08B3D
MSQVAFDALQASEELESAGISREQARAISLVVRRSHEVADVATKADIVEVNRNIADVRKDLSTEIADVRKDLSAEITNVRKDMEITRKDLQLEMSGIRAEQKLMRWMLGAGILGILSLVVKAFLMPAL